MNERDLDLVLVAECVSCLEFANWLAIQAGLESDLRLIQAGRSLHSGSGETDLELVFEDPGGATHVLLGENKIAAGFQPGQSARYAARRDEVQRRQHRAARTLLLAPEAYLGSDKLTTKGFDAAITYESMSAWLASCTVPNARHEFTRAMLGKAIEKAKCGYLAEDNEVVGAFWLDYWNLLQKLAPQLEMRRPAGKAARASFISMKPDGLPKGVRIVHKVEHGFLDLQFAKRAGELEQIRRHYEPVREPQMRFERASKSAVIRQAVPKLSTVKPLSEQLVGATEGIQRAAALLAWYRKAPLR